MRLYLQFGDPLVDLRGKQGHIHIAAIRPLVVRCVVLEERRLVVLTALPVLLAKSSH